MNTKKERKRKESGSNSKEFNKKRKKLTTRLCPMGYLREEQDMCQNKTGGWNTKKERKRKESGSNSKKEFNKIKKNSPANGIFTKTLDNLWNRIPCRLRQMERHAVHAATTTRLLLHRTGICW